MTDFLSRGKVAYSFTYKVPEEAVHARRRIGSTTESAMGWLLRFAQSDLSTLSIGDWTNLQYELTIFQEGMFFDRKDPLAFWEERTFLIDKKHAPYLVSHDQICGFQKRATRILEAIDKKQPIQYDFPSLQRALCFSPNTFRVHVSGKTIEELPGWHMRSFMRDRMEWLTYSMLELLKKHANLIRRCPEFEKPACQKLFLADRTNQHFCSVICQSRVATRRYRDEHGLRSGRPRGRPKKTSSTNAQTSKTHNLNQRRRHPNG